MSNLPCFYFFFFPPTSHFLACQGTVYLFKCFLLKSKRQNWIPASLSPLKCKREDGEITALVLSLASIQTRLRLRVTEDTHAAYTIPVIKSLIER